MAEMEDFSEIRRAVKEEFANSLALVDAADIQLCDEQGSVIEDLDDIGEEYYQKVKEGGTYLVVSSIGPVAKKPRATTKAVWKEEPKFIYSLEKERLFFVNRAHAVEQLQQIHRSKYNRASTGSGLDWIIPIADNVIGLGKSEFSQHYIRKCRDISATDELR